MRRLLLAALAAALAAPAPAVASDPIMALGDVQPGMRCTGLTVVRGTAISSFDVDVLDVLDRDRPDSARILVRVSGQAVDATGLGPGFSGSPILCTGADGVARNIGAISETIGEYGGHTAVATPIEAILAQQVQPPSGERLVGARSLAGPLTIAGVRPSLAARFTRAARSAGITLIASPAGTRAAFAPQPLAPGAAVAVGLTSGAIAVGVIGTVAYADGPSVWLFGHELDAAGRRSLFLQDAYIHTVVNNPIAVPDVSTYKLGAPGNDLGAVTSDGPTAVVGSLGTPPSSFPLRVTARDLDTGRLRSSVTRIADEGDVGRPAGASPLGLAGSAAVAEAAAAILGGAPARQSGAMCVKVTLRELRRPMRFCNSYAVDGTGPNALAGAASDDMAAAIAMLDGYRFGTLHPTAIEVGLRVRRGMRQAFMLGASAPGAARRGQTIRVRLRLRRTRTGVTSARTVRLRIPRDAPLGSRALRLAGSPAEQGSNPADDESLSIVFEPGDAGGDDPGPESLAALRGAFDGLARFDGVTAKLGGAPARRLYRDPRLRISGSVRVQLTIRRAARR